MFRIYPVSLHSMSKESVAGKIAEFFARFRNRIASRGNIVAVLDVGSHYLRGLIVRVAPHGVPKIEGFAVHPVDGMERGCVKDVERLSCAIRVCMGEARKMAGLPVAELSLLMGGLQVQTIRTNGAVPLFNHHDRDQWSEVTKRDVERVKEAASAVPLPEGRQIIDILPVGFKVDNQESVMDPVGMNGIRLEVEAFLLTGPEYLLTNLGLAVSKARFKVKEIVFRPAVTGLAVLTRDERELGACIVDIGAHNTSIAFYRQGGLQDFAAIDLGSKLIAADISHALGVSPEVADRIVLRHGHCYSSLMQDEELELDKLGGLQQKILRSELGGNIQPRIEEILEQAKEAVDDLTLGNDIPGGVILTGGVCGLPGFVGLAEQIFPVYVRVGENIGLEIPGCGADAQGFAAAAGQALDIFQRRRKIQQQDFFSKAVDGISSFFDRCM